MKLSARNQFKGTVVDIQEGAVNGIVKIDIGGGNVVSATISMNAIKELGLAPTPQQIETLARMCAAATGGQIGSAKVLKEADMAAIYKMAL